MKSRSKVINGKRSKTIRTAKKIEKLIERKQNEESRLFINSEKKAIIAIEELFSPDNYLRYTLAQKYPKRVAKEIYDSLQPKPTEVVEELPVEESLVEVSA